MIWVTRKIRFTWEQTNLHGSTHRTNLPRLELARRVRTGALRLSKYLQNMDVERSEVFQYLERNGKRSIREKQHNRNGSDR